MKKLLITIAINIVLIALLIISLKSINQPKTEKKQKVNYLSEYDSRKTMGKKVNTKTVPVNTGAKYEEIKYLPEENELGKLIELLPLKTDQFELQMDFKKDKIIVNLNPPYQTNQDEFFSWLKKNGYGEITQGNFVIYYK